MHHRPPSEDAWRGHVLVVPPFNEEANRCRSMVTLLARSLAEHGIGTLMVDLHGTGDSEGGYVDARWPAWLDDLRAGLQWLEQRRGGCVALLGIRLGAILAAQLQTSLTRDVSLVLWQPVLDGKLHVNQFLRVRMAAQLDRPDLPKENTSSMRKILASGAPLEVAGYELHPELVAAIDAARLGDAPAPRGPALWLEHLGAEETELPPPSVELARAWQERGASVEQQSWNGPMFWQVHERVVARAIIDRTSEWLRARVAA